MSITLITSLGPLPLPDDLRWVDEYDWSPVQQSLTPTLTGSLVVQAGVRLSGRPITLGPERSAVATRAQVEQLRLLEAEPTDTHTLVLHDGRSYPVTFRRTDGPGVQAEPVIDYPDPVATDPYYLVLRLVQVPA